MIHDTIKYIRRYDLEDNNTSTIWIEVENGNKKLLVMGGYRQWQLPKFFKDPQSRNSGPQNQ